MFILLIILCLFLYLDHYRDKMKMDAEVFYPLCWKHFKTVCTHKYWVGYFCFKAGLYWRGIMHDMSKFSPIEFFESVKYYQGTSSPINAAKANQGYSLAWQHHKGKNPHHYEYWTDNYDKGTTCIEMPREYVKELLCDYLGACMAYSGCSIEDLFQKEYSWWKGCKDGKKMHPNTKGLITEIFKRLKDDPAHYSYILKYM